VLLVIQGKVDDWRIQRQSTWCIVAGMVGSKDMPDITGLYGLPYDDELKEQDKKEAEESLQEWYNRASEESRNFKWN
jgi:uncharacterized protein YccT (UPF0319 family)